ncbi:MAG: hypothetical protein NTV06_07815, partial [candidate division Zixibacteria bacterium]|nr:hypothetical protein [candidate division Zixibacteria bacterium]
MIVHPDSLTFRGIKGETFHSDIEILNIGSGVLDWKATVPHGWVKLSRYSGTDNDVIAVELTTSELSEGVNYSQILIYDSASFNQLMTVPIEIVLLSPDTVRFSNVNAFANGTAIVPLSVILTHKSKGGYIPFIYDTALAILDSVVANSNSLPSFASQSSGIKQNGGGEIGFRIIDSLWNDSLIIEGNYNIANLYFTAGNNTDTMSIDILASDSSGPYIIDSLDAKIIPIT